MPSQITKQWWQSKTIWVNIVTFAVALLALFAADELFAPWAKYIVLGQSVLNLVLRFLTDKPILGAGNGVTKWVLIAALLVLPLSASTAWAADSVLIVKDLSPGQHVLLLNVGEDGSIEIDRPEVVGTVTDGVVTPPTTPPTDGLEAATEKALAAVPDHDKKEIAAQALAGIFREIGQQHADGNLPTEELFPTLDEAIDTVLGAFGVSQHWAGFRTTLKGAINAQQLAPAEIQPAFEQIAAGLSHDNEALIDIAPHVADLIQAIIDKDRPAMLQAVIQIVIALIGS